MPSNIISINSGSSSIKFSIFKTPEGNLPPFSAERIVSGEIEEIGTDFGEYRFQTEKGGESGRLNFKNHSAAFEFLLKKLRLNEKENAISVVVHRFVHGGSKFLKPVLITPKNILKLRSLSELAPLHNPPNIKGLEILLKAIPSAKQACVFDTSFHGSIPSFARLYPLPLEYYKNYGILKYGFHGISYSYIAGLLDIGKIKGRKFIICHLGNGASICAIKDGASVDTSMGYTPLDGLMMGTRCGSIDPSIPFILHEKLKIPFGEIYKILNKKSGLYGISGKTYDFKELLSRKDKNSRLAIEMYIYSIIRYIGQYASVLNGIDGLIFTGGIGENSDYLRSKVCSSLSYLGIKIDKEKNAKAAKHFQEFNNLGRLKMENSIKAIGSGKTPVLAVHTDEERQMVKEALNL